jgi:hypothetical protein
VKSGSKKWGNSDLPAGCADKNEWRCVFIPTVYTFVGSFTDPWTMDDETAAQGFQKIWNKVYHNRPDKPDHFHSVLPQKPVFGVAMQRICEWRAGFGSTALTFLNAFFATNKGYEMDESRKTFAQGKLNNFKFLYEFPVGENRKVSSIALARTRNNDDCPNRTFRDCSSAPLFYRHSPITSTSSAEQKRLMASTMMEASRAVLSHSLPQR